MAAFDSLIEILSSRFGLGTTARLLVSEIVAMISAPPGGLGGFLDKLKSAGLASEVASWLGHPDATPLAAGQVERALGATAVSGIASRMGLEQSIVTPALGYALPRIVGIFDARRRCSSRRPRGDHGFSLTTASRGGGGRSRRSGSTFSRQARQTSVVSGAGYGSRSRPSSRLACFRISGRRSTERSPSRRRQSLRRLRHRPSRRRRPRRRLPRPQRKPPR